MELRITLRSGILKLMGVFTWIFLGLVVGILSKLIMPGRDPGGFIVTTLLGIAGALLGGFIGTRLGIGTVTGFNLPSLGIAIMGAVILLIIYRLLRRR